jgi:hypothetical protein
MTAIGDHWYRIEDRRFSVADDWGDHAYTDHDAAIRVLIVTKVTPKGVKVKFGTIGTTHFILDSATRKFACPTVALALESYRARKRRQLGIYQARIDGIKKSLLAAEKHVEHHHRNLRAKELGLCPTTEPVSSTWPARTLTSRG